MTSAFSWQNSISLCPASFCTPRPDFPVTAGISWLPTFHSSPLYWKGHLFSFSRYVARCMGWILGAGTLVSLAHRINCMIFWQPLVSSEFFWNVDFAVWSSSAAVPWMPTQCPAQCQGRAIKDERHTQSLPSDRLHWGKSFQVLELLEMFLDCLEYWALRSP